MMPIQLLRPNRRDCHQRRGIPHHQPLQYSIDRPAPTWLPEAVIWIVDPKVPEISNPWDVEPSGEAARDDQPSKWRRTAKDDIIFHSSISRLPAGTTALIQSLRMSGM